MLGKSLLRIAGGLTGIAVALILLYQVPAVHQRLSWRLDFALAYARGVVNPVKGLPTPLPQPRVAITSAPTPTGDPAPTPFPLPDPTDAPLPSPTPLPSSAWLAAPLWEKQDINNCGPASLSMYLRFYGWKGDQFEISKMIKPEREDRNVNVEELAYYVRTRAGWLNVLYRVGGDIPLLKRLIAAGVPVMIEESFYFEEPYWPNDDLWAAHYLLVTGYDDASQVFTAQDSFHGPDRQVPYRDLDAYWKAFNRVYLLLYLPAQEKSIQALLGSNWDPDVNRQNALQAAERETQADPMDAFAWFNRGSNLVYFERYLEATDAYDQARQIGLPQRMLRYQFGPFIAYFHTGQLDDLMALTEYALERTPNAEEAMLWRGWAFYRKGDLSQAVALFRQALEVNPLYEDARYALEFVRSNQ